MNRKLKTVQDGIHSLGNASREVQKPHLKLILPSDQLTAVNCQSPGALLPITGLEQDIIKLGLEGENLSMAWSRFPVNSRQAYTSHHQIVIWICL